MFLYWQELIQIQNTSSYIVSKLFSFPVLQPFFASSLHCHKLKQPPLLTFLTSSVLSLPSLAQTRSHLWWGEVLYFINSRLHAKIHYANLLFSCTQACQLTCGTNFALTPLSLPSFLPSPPPLLLISMFRMWFTCIKGSLWRGPLCIAGPWLFITVKPLRVSLCFNALKSWGRCIQNANNADIVTSSCVIVQCWCLFMKHICMEWLLRIPCLIPFCLSWKICCPLHKFHTGFCVNSTCTNRYYTTILYDESG